MQKQPEIKMTKKHGSAYVRDGKVEYYNREHYNRDLKIAKLLSKIDDLTLLYIIENISNVRIKIQKITNSITGTSTSFEIIRASLKITKLQQSISEHGLKMISIIQESNPTSSGKVFYSDCAFDILKEFVLETKTRRDLIKVYGQTKARKLFSRWFYNEIKIKDSL